MHRLSSHNSFRYVDIEKIKHLEKEITLLWKFIEHIIKCETPEADHSLALKKDNLCEQDSVLNFERSYRDELLSIGKSKNHRNPSLVYISEALQKQSTITLDHSEELWVETLNSKTQIQMVFIPAGSFWMGEQETVAGASDCERPKHLVQINSFYISKYPITQSQWEIVAALPEIKRKLEIQPSEFKGENSPVECVSWLDATEFCLRLATKSGHTYRLPSEAEWEYACRAMTITPFHFGQTITTEKANYNGRYSYKVPCKGNYRKQTTSVGIFQEANKFGLHDMHGNVWEWCADSWHGNYYNAPCNGTAWEDKNIDEQVVYKVIRGGSWMAPPSKCRSASRSKNRSKNRGSSIGFRIACSTI